MGGRNGVSHRRAASAVACSLVLHAALVSCWLAWRPTTPGGQVSCFSTAVPAPADAHDTVFVLLDPPAAKPPRPAKATISKLPAPAIPAHLPPTIRPPAPQDDPGGVKPAVGSSDTALTPAPALHGKLKAGQSVVFVLDRSSSMGTDGLLARASAALRTAIRQLGPDVRFQIVAYNGGVTGFARDPVLATPQAIARADEWLKGVDAEGRSDHRAGFKEAVWHRPDAIVLLTDADDLEAAEVKAISGLVRPAIGVNVIVFGPGRERTAGETPLELFVRGHDGAVQYVTSRSTQVGNQP